MLPDLTNAVPKVHPATRGLEADDPMNLHAVEVDGDPQVMLQMLVEEYARMGFGIEELMDLARQPLYLGLHGLWQAYGEVEFRRQLSAILSRCGVTKVKVWEAPPPVSENLLQIGNRAQLEGNHHA